MGLGIEQGFDSGTSVGVALQTVAASGATPSLDLSAYEAFDVTLTADATFTFANGSATRTQEFTVLVRQDGTGNRTPTFPVTEWVDGFTPLWGKSPNAIELYKFIRFADGTVLGSGRTIPWDWTMRTGSLAQNQHRNYVGSAQGSITLVSGTLHLCAIPLYEGMVVSNITWVASATALSSGTNQWSGLFNSSRDLLAISTDKTSEAWAANALKTFAMSSAYVVPTTGVYYCGLMVAATTPPSLYGVLNNSGNTLSLTAPALSGRANTGQTTPPTPGAFTASALGGAVGTPWCDVS